MLNRRSVLVLALLAWGITPVEAQEKTKLDFDPYDQSKVPLEVDAPADFKGKKIVLVAGSKSHGSGDHEFFSGTAILMNLLKQTPGVWPVMVRDGWPKNEKIFDGAACVVFYMDGRGGHPVVKDKRPELLQKLLDQGTGWVNLHYAVDYDPKFEDKILSWMGGYYDYRISTNPHWDAEIRSLPKHPIANGVKPFTLRDEWYFNMRWTSEMKNVTPILVAIPPDNVRGTDDAKKHKGRPEIMAWAFERGNGGRSFGFTGGHSHRNWGHEDFRRLVTNAILWCAHVEVPESGAKVEFNPIDLNRNLDFKAKSKENYKPEDFKLILPPTPIKK